MKQPSTVDELEKYWHKRGYETAYLTDSQDFEALSECFFGLKQVTSYKTWHALLVVMGEAEYHACYAIETMYTDSWFVKLEPSVHKKHFKRDVKPVKKSTPEEITKAIESIFDYSKTFTLDT
jgi:hypothetical protein